MTEQLSPATSKRYTLSQICRIWGLARSSFYERLKRVAGSVTRRGARGAGSDEELVSAIKTLLSAGGFVSNATIFIMVDHCTRECLGLHAARHGTRFEALEVVRQAVHHLFGEFKQGIADKKLALRHDHGSQFISDHYQKELKFLGIRSTPSLIAEPQCNGVAERFIRTLKEQLLWLKSFSSVAQLNEELSAFKERYNTTWLVAKHHYLTPSEARAQLTSSPHSSEPLSRAS